MIGVYGANGFIGQHLVRRLISLPEQVRAISRRFDDGFTKSVQGRAELLIADMNDPFAIASSLQDVDVAIQLASTSNPSQKNMYVVEDLQNNVTPHIRFLEGCISAGVKRVVFLSSGGTVYGRANEMPISEGQATDPICSHGVSKLFVEKYMNLLLGGGRMQYAILRPSNVFGPGQVFRRGQGLIPAILARQSSRAPVKLFGRGEAVRDFLYVDDLIDAVLAAVRAPQSPDCPINIGSGIGRRAVDVLDSIEALIGARIDRECIDARETDVEANVLDISRARRLLEWAPKVAFEDGLARTVAAFEGAPADNSEQGTGVSAEWMYRPSATPDRRPH